MAAHVMDVLIFEIEGQRHGLPAAGVQTLLRAQTIMPVPGAPAGVEGVINLRGAIVPVLDMRWRLGLPVRPLALADHFIVICDQNRSVALHVDHAVQLATLDAAAASPIEPLGDRARAAPRVAKLGDGMVLLHEVAELLAAAPLAKEAS